MTSVVCKHCQRAIGSPQGLVSHIKSMHPEVGRAERERAGLAVVPPAAPAANGALRWEEPPVVVRGPGAAFRREVEGLVVELKRNPGRWARIKDYTSKSGANSACKWLSKAHPDIEFIGRAVDGGSAVWARAGTE